MHAQREKRSIEMVVVVDGDGSVHADVRDLHCLLMVASQLDRLYLGAS
jgi:hypothetical protein